MIVNDAHCHFFSSRFFDVLAAQAGRGGGEAETRRLVEELGWEFTGSAEALADLWVREMDRYDIHRAALMASIPGDEESVATAVARHPARLLGFFMLDPTREDTSGRIQKGLGELGLSVVCLFPAMHRFRLDSAECLRAFEWVAEHDGAAVFVHCGVLSVGVRKKLGLPSPFDIRLGNPLDLQTAADLCPRLPILIPHFGAGFLREALMLADLHPNVYLDTSSSNGWIKYDPGLSLSDVFRQALQVAGSERLLFGSDSSFFPRGWQHSIRDTQLSILTDLGAGAGQIENIFKKNFERLFGGVPVPRVRPPVSEKG